MNDDRTAPSLTHMEKARELLAAYEMQAMHEGIDAIARALAAEHDAALEKAALHVEMDGLPSVAAGIRAMKEGK